MEFTISQETVNKVLNYLAQRPFIEVAKLIEEVQQVKPLKVEEPVKE